MLAGLLWDTAAAAEYLGVSKSTIYRYAGRNGLPHIRKLFGLRFRKEDLDAWLENGRHKARLTDNILKNALTMTPPGGIDKANGGVKLATQTKGRRHYAYGSIYQRKPGGNWSIDYRDRNGRRVQKVVRAAITLDDAHEALRNAISKEFLKSQGLSDERKSLRFNELADMYIENYAKVNKESWETDMYRINAHMRSFFRDCEVEGITPLTIEQYRAKRLNAGVTRTTVNKETTVLKKIFNLAREWRLIKENPCASIKMFSEQGTQKERILTEEEESRLLTACPDYLRSIIVTAIHTGMRRGEVLNLKWKQVDLDGRTVRVEQTKSGRNRMIPINELLYTELLIIKSMGGGGDYVFPNPATDQPYTDVKKSFRAACKKADIEDLRFHDLRHTFASRLVRKGIDLITVRDLLGHFSVRVTQRYTHSNFSQMKQAVELLALDSRDSKSQ